MPESTIHFAANPVARVCR